MSVNTVNTGDKVGILDPNWVRKSLISMRDEKTLTLDGNWDTSMKNIRTVSYGGTLSFNFKGTSIRFTVDIFANPMNTLTTAFIIDGIDYRIPEGMSTSPTSQNHEVYAIQIDNLGNKEHEVKVKNLTSGVWTNVANIEYYVPPFETKTLISKDGAYIKWNEGNPYQEGKNLIPKMTSNISPSPYVASQSSSYQGVYNAYLAMDNILSNDSKWVASDRSFPQWIKIDLSTPQKAFSFQLSAGHADQIPNKWKIQGSNNETDWVNLYVATNSPLQVNTYSTFQIENPMSYRFYRLYIEDANGYPSISGWTLLSEPIFAKPSYWSTVSANLPTSNQFKEQGIERLSLLNRKVIKLEPSRMIKNKDPHKEQYSAFSKTIDLIKYFDIRKISIEVD